MSQALLNDLSLRINYWESNIERSWAQDNIPFSSLHFCTPMRIRAERHEGFKKDKLDKLVSILSQLPIEKPELFSKELVRSLDYFFKLTLSAELKAPEFKAAIKNIDNTIKSLKGLIENGDKFLETSVSISVFKLYQTLHFEKNRIEEHLERQKKHNKSYMENDLEGIIALYRLLNPIVESCESETFWKLKDKYFLKLTSTDDSIEEDSIERGNLLIIMKHILDVLNIDIPMNSMRKYIGISKNYELPKNISTSPDKSVDDLMDEYYQTLDEPVPDFDF